VVAHPDPAVLAPVALNVMLEYFDAMIGQLLTSAWFCRLWVWTWAPFGMSAMILPMSSPYLMAVSPDLRSFSAILWPIGTSAPASELGSGIVMGDTAQHVGAGRQPFDNDHADIVGMFMDEKMGNFRHNCLLKYLV
jgi:hypothetical protein